MKYVMQLGVAVLTAAILTTGCMPPGAMNSALYPRSGLEQPRANNNGQQNYLPLDWDRWSSKLYPEEFFGKSFVVEGYYYRGETAFGITDSISFVVYEKSLTDWGKDAMAAAKRGQYPSLDNQPYERSVAVNAPLSMRDTFYKLKSGSRIRVYGHVVNPYARSVFHGGVVMSLLVLQAERVEVL